jgi:hypothetical protein
MQKIAICKYWENGNCIFMEDSVKCCYAHGVEDLNMVECKYGVNCNNPKCLFDHGKSTISNMVYDIPIIDKIKIKKCKKIKNMEGSHIINNNEKYKNKNQDINIYNKKDKINNIILINKEKGIKDYINISNKDYNSLLSKVDEFYINKYNTMLYIKNNFISQIVKNNYKNIVILRNKNNDKDITIKKLQSKNNSLIKMTEELKTENKILSDKLSKNKINTMNKVVGNDNSKLKKLYNKYIELYKIFNNNSYKTINIEEIKKYTMDKNIYKVKQRSYKVYNFYQKYINGTIKEFLPISKIIKMVF